jgi:hypothetical protein
MMRAQITKDMISFIPVRRGEWIFKISVWKTKQVMVIAQNSIDLYKIYVECFSNQDQAADFIERLASEEL